MIEEQVWSAANHWKTAFTVVDTFFGRCSMVAGHFRRDFGESIVRAASAGIFHLFSILAVLA
jgi:hypothetical protein